MSEKMLTQAQANLILWFIATSIMFVFVSAVALPIVDSVAYWMVDHPCADVVGYCDDFTLISYWPMNLALFAIAGVLVSLLNWYFGIDLSVEEEQEQSMTEEEERVG